eukprot:TRINITY_DN7530_c0_g1_i1.p1 TRINITY_DN7530_c0_g1~~TRINITY_DN7530_c0_g1_i1.p1  ORF type:complete len:885 (-),score=187.58 TRINITY_DN7530_c0_g1_i1:58-2367(-)
MPTFLNRETTKDVRKYYYKRNFDLYLNQDTKDDDLSHSGYSGYSSHQPKIYVGSNVGIDNPHHILSDWNRRFRTCLRRYRRLLPTANLKDRIEANLNLMHLSQDFIHAATTYGKIIISEVHLPNKEKNIKPVSLGGIIGGQKYIVHNILFKFAMDYHGLFGNDYAAAKVAGNELRGLMSYFNCGVEELNVPLMCLVDYRGFRLIAMSLFPVDDSTLIYGSCDAGRSMVSKVSEFNDIMQKVAERINLKSHDCRVTKPKKIMVPNDENSILFTKPFGLTSNGSSNDMAYDHSIYDQVIAPDVTEYFEETEFLHSPADLEGHQGKDGRFYLLDFSRVLPPEKMDPRFKNSHLSRVLRPEFVRNHYKPLCPDAFSGFVKNTPHEEEHKQEIEEATLYIKEVIIPEAAKELTKLMQDAKVLGDLYRFRITEAVHSYGINCRHLGFVRKHVTNWEFKKIVLIEIIARAIKNNLRFRLREKVKQLKLPLEEPYIRLVADYLNMVFGNTKQSDDYWDIHLKQDIMFNWEDVLNEEEQQETFHLKLRNEDGELDNGFLEAVLERVRRMMGMTLSTLRNTDFNLDTPFDDTDIENIGLRVKHMNIISHAQGYFYHVKGLANRVENPEAATQFYQAAIEKYQEALDSDPNNKEILLSMALTWILIIEEGQQQVENAQFSRDDPKVQKAEEYSLRAIQAEPQYDSFSAFRYAQFLERCGRLDCAEDFYLMALEADPHNAGCLYGYGMLLSSKGFHDEAEQFFLQASKNTVGLSHWPDYYH